MDLLGDSAAGEGGRRGKGGLAFEPAPEACFDGQLRCGTADGTSHPPRKQGWGRRKGLLLLLLYCVLTVMLCYRS